ncbi:substrate-binding domain-containing protein [Alsobacter sp. SYSU BS001988]
MPAKRSALVLGIVALGVAALSSAGAPAAQTPSLRVCADPNNLPFSHADGSGFENAIARIVAADLGRPLEYAWWAQRRGFLRNTLMAGACDVVIGVPAHRFDMALRTRPYYRSSYVFVTRADRRLDLASLEDPRLRTLRIGVHLIGDGGANPPPAHALAQLGVIGNVVGYPIYGDYSQNAPPQRLIEAVARGDVDVAIAWGPLAGPAARGSGVPLRVSAIPDGARFAPLRFTFEIAMGVRRSDLEARRELQGVLDRRGDEIRRVLEEASVPLLPFSKPTLEIVAAPAKPGDEPAP